MRLFKIHCCTDAGDLKGLFFLLILFANALSVYALDEKWVSGFWVVGGHLIPRAGSR